MYLQPGGNYFKTYMQEKLKLDVLMHSLKTSFERKYLSELMENRAKSNNESVHESQSVSVDLKRMYVCVCILERLRIH